MIEMKNQRFLDKAMKLLPSLEEIKVNVVQTVEIFKDEKEIRIKRAEDYKQKVLKKGSKICLDFGDHQVGYLDLSLGYTGSHPDAPVWMKIHFAETPSELLEDGQSYKGWICSSWIEEEQIHVDVLHSVLKLPRRYAFRYVMIEILDISSKFDLVIKDAVCRAVSSAKDEEMIPFKALDAQTAKLDQTGCRTLHNCMQEVFEDGPKRDRRLWMGDLRIQALVNYETYKKNDMVKACLYLFAALPMENGQMGACLFLEPEPEVDDTKMFDYSLFFVNTRWDYYEETKDKEALGELWPTAFRQIQLSERYLTDKKLVRDSDVLGWCFVDWNLNLNKQASAQGILLYALGSAIKIASELGETATTEWMSDLYAECKNAAKTYLWDSQKQCYISGEERQVSVASQVWMILGGAVERESAAGLLQRVETITEVEKMVTPYMYHNYIDALLYAGEKDKALQKLKTYWGGMLEMGADTFWELYNPENPLESPYGGTIVNSYCHAWSCGPSYFLRKYFAADNKEDAKKSEKGDK